MDDNKKNYRIMSLRNFGLSYFAMSALMLAIVTSGCTQTQLNSTAVTQPPPMPLNQPADNYEWVKRLKISDPIEGIPQMARGAAQVAYRIPVPITAGSRYALIVDQQMRLAWLQGSDGKLGPWPLDQPDVTHLLNSVAIPPTNPAVAQ